MRRIWQIIRLPFPHDLIGAEKASQFVSDMLPFEPHGIDDDTAVKFFQFRCDGCPFHQRPRAPSERSFAIIDLNPIGAACSDPKGFAGVVESFRTFIGNFLCAKGLFDNVNGQRTRNLGRRAGRAADARGGMDGEVGKACNIDFPLRDIYRFHEKLVLEHQGETRPDTGFYISIKRRLGDEFSPLLDESPERLRTLYGGGPPP